MELIECTLNTEGVGFKGSIGGCVEWIDLRQSRYRWWAVVNNVMNIWVVYNAGYSLTSWETIDYSRGTLLHGGSEGNGLWFFCWNLFTENCPFKDWHANSYFYKLYVHQHLFPTHLCTCEYIYAGKVMPLSFFFPQNVMTHVRKVINIDSCVSSN